MNDSDIDKIERLADTWQVEMPEENFFINLPERVRQQAEIQKASWWETVGASLGAATAMVVILAIGAYFLGVGLGQQKRLMAAAAEWQAESASWEKIDMVLEEAQRVGVSGLHQYLSPDGVEKASLALAQSAADMDYLELLAYEP